MSNLDAYHQAASVQLGAEGPVVDWLGELVSGYAPA